MKRKEELEEKERRRKEEDKELQERERKKEEEREKEKSKKKSMMLPASSSSLLKEGARDSRRTDELRPKALASSSGTLRNTEETRQREKEAAQLRKRLSDAFKDNDDDDDEPTPAMPKNHKSFAFISGMLSTDKPKISKTLAEEPKTWADSKETEDDDADDAPTGQIGAIKKHTKVKAEDPLGILKPDKLEALILNYKKNDPPASPRGPPSPRGASASFMAPSTSSMLRGASSLNVVAAASSSMLNPMSSDFNPTLYITVVHRGTSFARLKEALAKAPREQALPPSSQIKTLVKDNLDRFVASKDTVDNILQQIRDNEMSRTGSGTTKLERTYKTVLEKAEAIYRPLLERKQEIDSIRNQLAVLRRFQFLFNLPAAIKENVKQGEGDKVVRDYKKALALGMIQGGRQGGGGVGVVKRVLTEVEGIVEEYRRALLRSLEDPSLYLEDQETSIRLLQELGCRGDPAVHFLRCQFTWITTLFNQCLADPKGMKKLKQVRDRGMFDSEVGSSNVRHSGPWNLTDSTSSTADDSVGKNKKSKVVKRLTVVLENNIPDFWKIAQNVSAADYSSTGARETMLTSGVLNEAKKLITQIVLKYAEHVKKVLLPPGTQSLNNSLIGSDSLSFLNSSLTISGGAADDAREHIKESLPHLQKSFHKLKSLQGLPPSSLKPLSDLMEEITRSYVMQLCSTCVREAGMLYLSEDWLKNEQGVTSLPTEFAAMLKVTLKELEGVVTDGSPFAATVRDAYVEAIKAFADSLHHLAFTTYLDEIPKEDKVPTGEESEDEDETDGVTPSLDYQLLLVSSNTAHMVETILPDLFAFFTSHYKASESLKISFKELSDLIKTLEKLVIDAYIKNKTIELNGKVKLGINLSGVDWAGTANSSGGAGRVTDVNDYVMDLLFHLILIHAEVFSANRSKTVIEAIFSKLFEYVVQAFIECLSLVEQIGKVGYLQLKTDIGFVEQVLNQFKSTKTRALLEEFDTVLYDICPDYGKISKDEVAAVDEILKKAKTRTKIMFECFSK
eukprot:TRINITY_DN7877_c0_g1_i1.p1 TRINITY_DN7877_c0_g1~~TRINITY_DN7877_c0_g1_i1.p1  ORF type:complete len:1018 (+),score=319.24 TRINITY_DN7877_c0_g1_i1:475-3528(+)